MLPSKQAKRDRIKKELSDTKRSDLGEQFAALHRELMETDKSMLVIVDGWESSGKGYLLKDLTRELDPKHYEVSVFEESSKDESQHPYLYRFFVKSPKRGQIVFFDRSFYYDLFNNPSLDEEKLKHYIEDVSFIEKALTQDDTLVLKFFLHQSKNEMKKNITRLEKDDYRHVRLNEKDYNQLDNYSAYYKHFKKILNQTNYHLSPWHILYVEGKKDTSRQVLQLCLDELDTFLKKDVSRFDPQLPEHSESKDKPLDQVDLSLSISDKDYDKELDDLQKRAGDLLYQVYIEKKAIVVVYEGTDAAGKGGNIERLTRLMDPRGYDVATTAAPTQEEKDRHYLWRFYRDFPTDGRMTIFDRSWYGRVLVERIEELTPSYRWKEAYDEINQMEHNLNHQGYLVLKYLIIIDKEEQLKRFEARAEDPMKQHKLTDEDWRNHEQFDAYKEAMNEMVHYTSTNHTPWKIISGTSKKYARIAVLKDFIESISDYLDKE
ncbi:phosphate:AMP phosphotransferase [Alkalibacterium iburiense]